MNSDRGIFAERLRAAAAVKGVTYRDMADATGVSHGAVAKWATGVCYPRSSQLLALCEYLECSIDWLMNPEPIDLVTPSQARLRGALEEIATGEIVGETTNHRDTVAIMRHVARRALGTAA